MVSRRKFLSASVLLGAPGWASAQKQSRIALLSIGTDPDPLKPNVTLWVPFLDELKRRGYEEGRNLAIERRFAGGKQDRIALFSKELAQLRPDVVIATSDVECVAAHAAMPATPLVMVLVQDPVGAGLITTFAKPGGSVTGLSTLAPEIYAKRLQLLKELVPGATRVGVLLNPTSTNARFAGEKIAAAARSLGVHLKELPVQKVPELQAAFSTAASDRLHAILLVTDGVMFSQRRSIADLAAHARIPVMYEVAEFTDAGGLMSYGPNYPDMAIRAADYVDRILKGARPADLPVQLPTKFDMVLNARAAKALGLAVQPSILLRADRVIE